MKKRHVFSAAVIISGCIFLLAALAVISLINLNAAPSPGSFVDAEGVRIENDGAAVIEIQDGESSIAAGRRLFEAGIIKSVFFWNILSRFERGYIKAGVYQIDLSVSQSELYKILLKGRQKLFRLTVPEGATLRKTAAILENSGICTSASFMRAAEDRSLLDEYRVPGKTMEGYLYPDTYLFQANYPAELVVRKMADTFFGRLDELGLDAYAPGELYEKVTLASIIEREYRAAEEAAVIAGVFKNRLESGMRLESCATVEYIITEIEGKPHPLRLFNRDIQIQNPYNTYIRAGLPPGPIAAPGATALKAAFAPENNDFLFFRVVDPVSGKHYFSKTFDEHIEAGELFVKGNR
jgi:UPF0755 protein